MTCGTETAHESRSNVKAVDEVCAYASLSRRSLRQFHLFHLGSWKACCFGGSIRESQRSMNCIPVNSQGPTALDFSFVLEIGEPFTTDAYVEILSGENLPYRTSF
jgi:hypothetical protein